MSVTDELKKLREQLWQVEQQADRIERRVMIIEDYYRNLKREVEQSKPTRHPDNGSWERF